YCREDREAVTEIASRLEDRGIKIWVGRPRLSLRSVVSVDPDQRTEPLPFCYCLGPTSDESEHFKHEIVSDFNLMSKHKCFRPIIPIILPGGDWSHLPNELVIYRHIDFSDGINAEGLDSLASMLARKRNGR
ncbi:TIR domain-containing protein, partial [Thermodesulfobacteriota bacterium]